MRTHSNLHNGARLLLPLCLFPMMCKRFCELAGSWVNFLRFLSCLLKDGAPSRADTVMGNCQCSSASAARRLSHMHNGPASNEVLLFTHSFQPSAFPSFFFACALIHPLTSAVITQTADKKRPLCSFIVPVILVLL